MTDEVNVTNLILYYLCCKYSILYNDSEHKCGIFNGEQRGYFALKNSVTKLFCDDFKEKRIRNICCMDSVWIDCIFPSTTLLYKYVIYTAFQQLLLLYVHLNNGIMKLKILQTNRFNLGRYLPFSLSILSVQGLTNTVPD